jgi:hypothetical protein
MLLLLKITDDQSRSFVEAFIRNDVHRFLAEIPASRSEWTRDFLTELREEISVSDTFPSSHIDHVCELSVGPLVASHRGSFAPELLRRCLNVPREELIMSEIGLHMVNIACHDFQLTR